MANEDATFCPYCAKPIKVVAQKKRTAFPITAGVLAILSSCVAIGIGILAIYEALTESGYGWGYVNGVNLEYVVIGIFGILAFSFGLSSGIIALLRNRKYIAFSIFGLSFMLAFGILIATQLWYLGLPMTILSILSIIFVAISKAEFS